MWVRSREASELRPDRKAQSDPFSADCLMPRSSGYLAKYWPAIWPSEGADVSSSMRKLASILASSILALISSCEVSNEDDGGSSGAATIAGGTGGTGTGGTASGGRAGASGDVPCLTMPVTGNYCERDGICAGNPNCRCVNRFVQCSAPQQQGGGQQQGQGGTAPFASCGDNPSSGEDCAGDGVCAGTATCFCANGWVSCVPGGGRGQQGSGGGARAEGGQAGAPDPESGGAGSTNEGGSSGEGAATQGGVGGKGTAGQSGSSGETSTGIVCPARPTHRDPCRGEGECPNAPGCFCIEGFVVGGGCRS